MPRAGLAFVSFVPSAAESLAVYAVVAVLCLFLAEAMFVAREGYIFYIYRSTLVYLVDGVVVCVHAGVKWNTSTCLQGEARRGVNESSERRAEARVSGLGT